MELLEDKSGLRTQETPNTKQASDVSQLPGDCAKPCKTGKQRMVLQWWRPVNKASLQTSTSPLRPPPPPPPPRPLPPPAEALPSAEREPICFCNSCCCCSIPQLSRRGGINSFHGVGRLRTVTLLWFVLFKSRLTHHVGSHTASFEGWSVSGGWGGVGWGVLLRKELYRG